MYESEPKEPRLPRGEFVASEVTEPKRWSTWRAGELGSCLGALAAAAVHYGKSGSNPLNDYVGTLKLVFGGFAGSMIFMLASVMRNFVMRWNRKTDV